MEQVRVAHVSPAFFSPDSVVGGGERYVYYLARAIATPPGSVSPSIRQTIFAAGQQTEAFEESGIPVRILPNVSSSSDKMASISDDLWRVLGDFDLVHVHQSLTPFGAHATVVAKSLGKPTVLTDLGGGSSRIMTEGGGLNIADAVLSISAYAHSLNASSYCGYHEIVSGPVDTDYFRPAADNRNGSKSVLCVSRILPHKGIDRVIRALPPSLTLRIVGAVYNEDYYRMLRQIGTGKNVEFIHDADDAELLSHYQSATVFAQASTYQDCYGTHIAKPELMGLTVLEALSCGLPVIVSNVGSMPELIPDPDFGRSFSESGELAELLQSVSAGEWPPADARAKARDHVLSNYSFEVVGARLRDFYQTVLNRAHSR